LKNNKSIYITGSSGFVGNNILKYFNNRYLITKYLKGDLININEEIVLNCAGKAHDLKNSADSNQYYQINTEFTKAVFDKFLESHAKVFITISSVKAVADTLESVLTEDFSPNPITHYGKSKLLAEQYILSKDIPACKRFYILRPCMIHGPGNKGNLNLLFKFVRKGIPRPLGAFNNKRSFCSIDNLCFIINELIENENIKSGIYNIADDEPLSTNELISLIAQSQVKKIRILIIPKFIIKLVFKIGEILRLPINSEILSKLTENFIVSNKKIKNSINKNLPISSKEGLLKTFKSLEYFPKSNKL
jgi:nucleoside-diphosphate-sugar epimerase